jgi:hypothetical protein
MYATGTIGEKDNKAILSDVIEDTVFHCYGIKKMA